jgi:cytidyltransferase-like protein
MVIAYVHGRFQPFHKGHLALCLYALSKYDELWVGISNPLRELPSNLSNFESDLKASLMKARDPKKNIFSYLERESMILKSLEFENIDLKRIKILPHFGYYDSKNWQDFLPDKTKSVLVIHSKDLHHELKLDLYEKLGWRIEQVPLLEKGVSGTEFHNEYPNGNWQKYVPEGTKEVLEEILRTKN